MMFLKILGSAEHQLAQKISPPYFAWGIWGGSRLIKYHLIIGVSNILINELCMGFKMMLLEWKVQAGAKAVVHPIRRAGNPLVGLHVRRTDYIKKVLLLFLYNMIRIYVGGEQRRNQEFRFRFRQCRYRNFWQEKTGKFVNLWIDFREDIFPVYFYSESESYSFKSIQRITNSPAFFLPDIPIPALPEPESKLSVPVPLTP